MDRRTYLGLVSGAGVASLAGCLGDSSAWDGSTVSFVLPPFQDAEELTDEWQPTFDWVADGLEDVDTVEPETTTSYVAAVEELVNGHSELGTLSTMVYVLAKDEGVEPLAINYSHGSDSYHTYIVTRDDTDIESLEDLEGKEIAMVDELSASGGIFPRYTIGEAGLDVGDIDTEPGDFDIYWSGDHGNAREALENGHVDAAAYGDFEHERADDDITVIAESDPIPFDVVVATPETPDEIKDELTDHLLEADGENLPDRVDEFGEYDEELYDQVREIASEMGVDIETLDEAEDADDE